ncbi:hypothetical protein [Streptomyces sp. AV19]|nr:hypothetical protein [Streptomyces sp. AV19]MDG4533650.1 hypothetical protein [Streptomyces sp. AV19]
MPTGIDDDGRPRIRNCVAEVHDIAGWLRDVKEFQWARGMTL